MSFCCDLPFGRPVVPRANRAGVVGGDPRKIGRYNCKKNKSNKCIDNCCNPLQPGEFRGCRLCHNR